MGTYWTNCGKKINARIAQKSPNVLNLLIENTELNQERLVRLKLAAAVLFMYAFVILFTGSSWNFAWVHAIFVAFLIVISYSYTRIVKNENLVLVKDFALQYSTNYIGGGAKNVLIPIKHIHDVVINEVFLDLKVVFILAVLTKGNLFKNRPTVTLLNIVPGDILLRIVTATRLAIFRRIQLKAESTNQLPGFATFLPSARKSSMSKAQKQGSSQPSTENE